MSDNTWIRFTPETMPEICQVVTACNHQITRQMYRTNEGTMKECFTDKPDTSMTHWIPIPKLPPDARDEGSRFMKQRERNSRQVCAYCDHAQMKTFLTVKYPSGRTELFGLCDDRCKRYFCFQVNPVEMRDR